MKSVRPRLFVFIVSLALGAVVGATAVGSIPASEHANTGAGDRGDAADTAGPNGGSGTDSIAFRHAAENPAGGVVDVRQTAAFDAAVVLQADDGHPATASAGKVGAPGLAEIMDDAAKTAGPALAIAFAGLLYGTKDERQNSPDDSIGPLEGMAGTTSDTVFDIDSFDAFAAGAGDASGAPGTGEAVIAELLDAPISGSSRAVTLSVAAVASPPVTVLLGVGLLCVIAGNARRRRRKAAVPGRSEIS